MSPATRCGSALSRHPIPVEAVGECAGEILDALDGERADLLVCFASPHYSGTLEDVTGGLRKLLEPDVLVGGVFAGVAGGSTEVENGPALSVLAVSLGGGHATPILLEARTEDDGTTITGWPDEVPARGTLLLLAEAATFPADDFLAVVGRGLPDLRVAGGLASPGALSGDGRLALDDRVLSTGAVGVLLDPAVPVRTLVSQGCRPVGRPFTVTGSAGHRIEELAGRPALERLREVAEAIAGGALDTGGDLMRRGIQVGIVVDEHKFDFRRGDFLVRALREIDDVGGSLTVGARVAVGQTVQFQVRDAVSAGDDLRRMLAAEGAGADAALLFLATGRGERLFGEPGHDAGTVQALAGPLPLAGAFCSAEIGPVGGRSEMHTYSAGVVLFG